MKKILSLIGFILLGTYAFAQEVSLVTSGEGTTKDAATASALRSAIEQSFGVFVSANTTILNDDLVRDEVATVASGNIKSYKELSCVQHANDVYMVSVEAVVSIGKLIAYAKSHGSSAEFAGQTFAFEMKMRELNKKNEREALQHLLIQLKGMQDNLFDYEIHAGNPRQSADCWDVPVFLALKTNRNYRTFRSTLTNTLRSLALSDAEQRAYRSNNTEFNPLQIDFKSVYMLRSSRSELKQFASQLCDILNDAQQSCVIVEKGGKHRRRFPLFGDISLCDVGADGVLVNVGLSSKEQFQDADHQFPFSMVPAMERGETCILVYNRGNERDDTIGTLLQTENQLFASSVHVFRYTAEEISQVSGFEVVRCPLSMPEEKRRRFETIAGGIGFPYKITAETATITYKIPLAADGKIDINILEGTFNYLGVPSSAPRKTFRLYRHDDDGLYCYLEGFCPGTARPISSRYFFVGFYGKNMKDDRGDTRQYQQVKEAGKEQQKPGLLSRIKNMFS